MTKCNATQGCSGQIEDGYCNVCGSAPMVVAPPSPTKLSGVNRPTATPVVASAAPAADGKCNATAGCTGDIEDGYCNQCGSAPAAAPATVAGGTGTSYRSTVTGNASTNLSGKASGGTRRSKSSGRLTSKSANLGLGLVAVPDIPKSDPLGALMAEAKVPDNKRVCAGYLPDGNPCEAPLKREKGFCTKCRTKYNFIPGLDKDELVADQYRIKGCIAFGGMGWIYLAHDETLNRYVVLKGLVNKDDVSLQAAAVAERQFLAEVKHPNIMSVYTVVQHTNQKGTAAYTVTEFIGGKTLKSIRKKRGPVPVAEALAYMVPVLKAFGYMHGIGLIYNDFKMDNVMVEDGDIKVIDLGGVCRANQTNVDIFSTVGYAAPELATAGPSFSSDVFTIGRTLMVLTTGGPGETPPKGYTSSHQYKLRTPDEEPVYAQYPSFFRLLFKACHENPDLRFQTCDEFLEQLVGVMREVVAIDTGTPRPSESHVFGPDPLGVRDLNDDVTVNTLDIESLPQLRMELTDPASAFIQTNVGAGDPRRQVSVLQQAVEQFPDSIEAKLAQARNMIRLGQYSEADVVLKAVEAMDGFDFRVIWYRGLSYLAQKDYANAVAAFDTCYSEVPGELAPKLAMGIAAELGGQGDLAAQMYDAVSRTDPSYTTAAFGLSRTYARTGKRQEAVQALLRIPQTSNLYVDAQKALALALVDTSVAPPAVTDLERAAQTIEALVLQGLEKIVLVRDIMSQALALLQGRQIQPAPTVKLFGSELEETAVRRSLEKALRDLAKLEQNQVRKIELIDQANALRPTTLI